MEYIWETVGQENEKFFFKQAEIFGPYSEVVSVKKDENDRSIVEYNSLFRFDHIFADMLNLQETEGEWTGYFFDACTHLLMSVEGMDGVNQKEFKIRRLMYEIKNGTCLKLIQDDYNRLSAKKQYEIASYYILQEKIGESVLLYGKAITGVLETGVVYKCKIAPKELLVYMGEKLSGEKEILWKILNYCFLPISYEVRLFEQTHFALMDEEQTMKYESLELF